MKPVSRLIDLKIVHLKGRESQNVYIESTNDEDALNLSVDLLPLVDRAHFVCPHFLPILLSLKTLFEGLN